MRDQWPNRRGRIPRPLAIQRLPGDTRISLHQLHNRQLSPGHAILPRDCGNEYEPEPEAGWRNSSGNLTALIGSLQNLSDPPMWETAVQAVSRTHWQQ